jgi:outer membrane protein OmpA-like peptidoglycan-associated protein
MPHCRIRPTSLARRIFVQALVASVIPVASALAQEPTYVRVTSEQANVRLFRNGPVETVMRAPRGTLLEVMHTRGDRFVHRDDNWYWVLLPGDSWGTQRMGWLPGSEVEHAPAPPRPKPAPATTLTSVSPPPAPREAPMVAVAPKPAPEPVAPKPIEPVVSEVLLHFAFDKSDLSAEARARLDDAMATLKANGQGGVSFALEGHADWTGPEGYNEKLGQARADAVRQHLAAQHQVSPDKVSIVSYGESKPAASNDTREGRAQNRRVVVKVTP